ncbi:hypothetical protein K458DRAFT_392532 [Lentithecium fluviatile CBS 122367]|uniref:Uncharacterized protein n=1 Tax=Lentithecium fluviatile CBS 122367 TaxID=1168545 RepID=A0A6G1ISC4_9PLEO|nr:hypothetical protein K458DRAFT_392532 [Lentithecium fluviatile CBS 122367]
MEIEVLDHKPTLEDGNDDASRVVSDKTPPIRKYKRRREGRHEYKSVLIHDGQLMPVDKWWDPESWDADQDAVCRGTSDKRRIDPLSSKEAGQAIGWNGLLGGVDLDTYAQIHPTKQAMRPSIANPTSNERVVDDALYWEQNCMSGYITELSFDAGHVDGKWLYWGITQLAIPEEGDEAQQGDDHLQELARHAPLMDEEYSNSHTSQIMEIIIRGFQSPDEEMKKIVLKVDSQCAGTAGVTPVSPKDNIREKRTQGRDQVALQLAYPLSASQKTVSHSKSGITAEK